MIRTRGHPALRCRRTVGSAVLRAHGALGLHKRLRLCRGLLRLLERQAAILDPPPCGRQAAARAAGKRDGPRQGQRAPPRAAAQPGGNLDRRRPRGSRRALDLLRQGSLSGRKRAEMDVWAAAVDELNRVGASRRDVLLQARERLASRARVQAAAADGPAPAARPRPQEGVARGSDRLEPRHGRQARVYGLHALAARPVERSAAEHHRPPVRDLARRARRGGPRRPRGAGAEASRR